MGWSRKMPRMQIRCLLVLVRAQSVGHFLLGAGEYTNPTRDQTNLVRDCSDPSSFLICVECTRGSEHSKHDGIAGMSQDGIGTQYWNDVMAGPTVFEFWTLHQLILPSSFAIRLGFHGQR